ncbi:MAG: hypothetical protein COA41_15610 [Sphingopyxis sp.]|nr:MAG: hypothetical protein COA41_15610 [Sphingopyxis sp.]
MPAQETADSSDKITLETGFPIIVRIDEQLGSKLSSTGQYFKLSLAEPVMYEGHILIPAGVPGQGQVVHAKKGGFSGSAGELILAARHVEYNGRKIKLRSMKFAETGKDNTGTAMAVGIAVGVVGFLVSGGNTIVEPGTTANAKFAEDTIFTINPQEIGPSESTEGFSGSDVNE